MSTAKKKVLVFGTFDRLHKGHEFFLRSAKKQGDFLVVIIARDNNVRLLKGKTPQENEQVRLKKISALLYVDQARLGYKNFKRRNYLIRSLRPHVICLGYDQKALVPEGRWKVVRLKPYKPHIYKSSLLKNNPS